MTVPDICQKDETIVVLVVCLGRGSQESLSNGVSWFLGGRGGRVVGLRLALEYIYYKTHKKPLRIQQHPASASTATLKNSTWTGQGQASRTA
jgi:hypothetical protein